MNRSIALAATLTALAFLAAVPAAQARSSHCSPTGDYCTQIGKRNGKTVLVISTFSFRGKVRVCVTAPDKSRTCKRFRLLSVGKGVYRSTKGYRANFPKRAKGVYRVTWSTGGSSRLGPVLSFRIR